MEVLDGLFGRKNPNFRFFFWAFKIDILGGDFKYVLFSSLFGEDEPILTNIFQLGWNHHLVSIFQKKFYQIILYVVLIKIYLLISKLISILRYVLDVYNVVVVIRNLNMSLVMIHLFGFLNLVEFIRFTLLNSHKISWSVPGLNLFTLPETIIAPENWWLEDYIPFGIHVFSSAMLVSRRVFDRTIVAWKRMWFFQLMCRATEDVV